MSYSVSPGNIFGRVGQGIGKGLADQVPKEIERNRLASGLKQLGEQKGLTPFQQYAGLVGAAHEYPQVVQSGADLLKTQAQRGNYANRTGGQQGRPETQIPGQNRLDDVKFANMQNRSQPNQGAQEGVPQGNYPAGEPQIVEKNPLSPEFQPRIPWTPEQRDSEIGRVWDQNPQLTFPEVSAIVSDNERRFLESPEAYQKQQGYLEEQQDKINTEVDSQLRKKLQVAKDTPLYGKITGENINRIERGVARDLKKNPNANVKDVVNTWTDRALDNAKNQSELKKIGGRNFFERAFKQGTNLDKLQSMSKSYKDFGNSEEFYNDLKAAPFELSPEGAASIAYPLSKQAKGYIDKIKPKLNFYPITSSTGSEYAANLGDYLTHEDSILSIAKNIADKDPSFDATGFLSEVRAMQDELGLSPLQKREINAEGTFDVFPNWGDVFVFPKGR